MMASGAEIDGIMAGGLRVILTPSITSLRKEVKVVKKTRKRIKTSHLFMNTDAL